MRLSIRGRLALICPCYDVVFSKGLLGEGEASCEFVIVISLKDAEAGVPLWAVLFVSRCFQCKEGFRICTINYPDKTTSDDGPLS